MMDGSALINKPVIAAQPEKRRRRPFLVADLFCGAGGTDRGARTALEEAGFRMELVAVNHDDAAIASHRENFPDARQHIADVNAAKPWLLVPEGYLDLLMASPECTHHSRARGGKPTSDQQRMDPWAIITWISQLRIRRLLIENVPEFVSWGPVDHRTGRPIKSRQGEYFRAWTAALASHGMRFDYRIINCADHGDATTRKRFFLIGRSDRKPLRWPQPTHAQPSRARMLGLEPWRSAREIIDWSIPGRSIFGRKKPLAPNTLARIEAGIVKFGWPEPFLVILRQHMAGRSLDEPLPTVAAAGNHMGLAQPFMLPQASTQVPTRDVDAPVPTITTVSRIGIVEPIVVNMKNGSAASSIDDPAPTITAHSSHLAVVEPFVLSQASGGAARSVEDPVPAIPCGGAHALIAPYYGEGSGKTCKTVDDPLDTITTRARLGLVMPVTHNDTSLRARDLDEPLPTITTARRGELAFITAAFGERPGQAPRVHSIDDPAPTVCAAGRINLVAAKGYDILFRMLEPHELAGAMSLHDHRFVGTKEQQTRQVGNAVPAKTAAALVNALIEEDGR